MRNKMHYKKPKSQGHKTWKQCDVQGIILPHYHLLSKD